MCIMLHLSLFTIGEQSLALYLSEEWAYLKYNMYLKYIFKYTLKFLFYLEYFVFCQG